MTFQSRPRAEDLFSRDNAINRVLAVDDSPAQLRTLTLILERLGMRVLGCRSAEDALGAMADFDPDFVVSDWVMPGMSGPDFCAEMRRCDDRFRYFVLLTSKTEKEDVARGLDLGADDFLSKPIDGGGLRARLKAGARIVAMERDLSTRNAVITRPLDQLQDAHAAIEQDLSHARDIQRALVPERSRTFGRTRVSVLLEPCGHVGGDLVGMFDGSPGMLGAYNIDVSGHGIASALISAQVAGHLNDTYPEENIALEDGGTDAARMRLPHYVARRLNQRFLRNKGISEYMTMAYVTLDLRTGYAMLVQAGHPPPLLLRADGTHEFVGSGGMPVGLISEASYSDITFNLRSGDRLLIYSDGFSEAASLSGELLEEDGLVRLATRLPAALTGTDMLDRLSKVLDAWRGGIESEDDVSAVLIEFDTL